MFISLQARGGVSILETQEGMQEIVHRIQPSHGSNPTVDEWAKILQKEENRAIKNSLLDSVGRHSNWFFGPKLKAVLTALTLIRND